MPLMPPPRSRSARSSGAASRSLRPPALDASTRIAVLYGSDDLLKRTCLQELRAALEQAHGQVETYLFDGKTADLASVLDELRSYSLLDGYKLVTVDEADQFVKNHRDALERYAQQPVDHATLVLRAATWHKGNLDRLIEKAGALIRCDTPKPDEARQWLIDRARQAYDCPLEPRAAQQLVERLGVDRMRLDNELAKLALAAGPGQTITTALVDQLVGRGSEEQAWAVQEAALASIRSGSAGPIIAKVHELVDLADQPPALVSYFLADLFRKLSLAAMFRQAGWPEGQIARELKLWGDRQRIFFDVLRRLDLDTIKQRFDAAVDAAYRDRMSLGEPMRNLECFCASLVDTGS